MTSPRTNKDQGLPKDRGLSRRERQIMDILFPLGDATVSDVVERMPDNPTYNSVRVTLTNLEKKGHVRHKQKAKRYVFSPTTTQTKARRSAVTHLLETFFAGSPSQAILTMLDISSERLSKQERQEIARMLKEAEGKKNDD